jgi:hypothetical protein
LTTIRPITADGGTITLGSNVASLTVDGGGEAGDIFTVIGTPTVVPIVKGVTDSDVNGTAGNDTIDISAGMVPPTP